MDGQSIGKVIHYYDKAGVAVVKLDEELKIGDTIKIVKGGDEFEMSVNSMQIDHQPVSECAAGGEVAIKVPAPAKVGALIYRSQE